MNILHNTLVVLTVASVFSVAYSGSDCDRMTTQYGTVCKCTENYCDYLTNPVVENENSWTLISSSKDGLRFSQSHGEFDSKNSIKIEDYHERMMKSSIKDSNFAVDSIMLDWQSNLWQIIEKGQKSFFSLSKTQKTSSAAIAIDRSITYQEIVGFGGALTGSVAHLLNNLKPKLQEHLYKTYFHPDGIGYNLLRTSIGGCDFDLEPWAYNEQPPNDGRLTNFTQLDARDELKVEQIKKIKSIAGLDDLKIMAAAWSPPPWMKSNGDWTGFSYLKPEYYHTWAEYHMKYLELMQAKNITIWAISTGNEPLNGVIGWFFVHFMSLGWTPTNQAIFLNDNLGPLLKNSKFKNVLIFGNDDQRYTYPQWFQKMNSSRPNSLNYLDGLAVHWYWDDIFGPELIDNATKLMPDALLLNTESCVGDKPWQTRGPELGSWERAEQYIRSYLQDLQHNFNGYIDWNLVLNEQGGPNYVNNFVDAAIIVNATNNTEFYKQPIFYTIGQFTKFITPQSKRINLSLLSLQKSLDAVGFKRPDDTIVVIIFNGASIPQDITLSDGVRRTVSMNLPPHSIHTMLYK